MSAPLDLPEHLFVAIDHVGVAVPDLDAAIELYRTAARIAPGQQTLGAFEAREQRDRSRIEDLAETGLLAKRRAVGHAPVHAPLARRPRPAG